MVGSQCHAVYQSKTLDIDKVGVLYSGNAERLHFARYQMDNIYGRGQRMRWLAVNVTLSFNQRLWISTKLVFCSREIQFGSTLLHINNVRSSGMDLFETQSCHDETVHGVSVNSLDFLTLIHVNCSQAVLPSHMIVASQCNESRAQTRLSPATKRVRALKQRIICTLKH